MSVLDQRLAEELGIDQVAGEAIASKYADGCFCAIWNPAAHQYGEREQRIAAGYFAAFNILGRWIDDWALGTTP